MLQNRTWVRDEDGIESIVSGCNFSTGYIRYKFPQAIERSPSPEGWARLQRYASRVRGLYLGYDGNIPTGTLFQLSSNSTGGVLYAKLEWLRWDVQETSNALPFFCLFLSPHPKRVALYNSSVVNIPEALSARLGWIILVLPTSLKDLAVMRGLEEAKISQRCHICLGLSMCVTAEDLSLPCTFIGDSYSPHHAAPKSTRLGHRPGSPFDHSVIHSSIPRGALPRTSGPTLASSFRAA